ncbi:MAG TPA: hypothetical protein PLD20_33480 [Blastocatellia bacterium]|nr:hypothetical protein [Blastocatellia bacterium]HNG31507.1 hypothetical protein [Blastocatellia bacterium]
MKRTTCEQSSMSNTFSAANIYVSVNWMRRTNGYCKLYKQT